MNQVIDKIVATAGVIPKHVSVDQEPDKDEEELDDQPELAEAPAPQDSMAAVAEGEIGFIKNLKGARIPVKAQPGGVWVAVTLCFNRAITQLTESLGDSGIANLMILNEVQNVETATANKLRDDALDDMFKNALPKLLNVIANTAPRILAEIVTLIIEPEPIRIRDSKDLTYKIEDVLWDIAVDQQVKALVLFVDSLKMEDIKKKAMGFLAR